MIICESSGLLNDASVAMKVLSGLASPPIAEIPADPAIDEFLSVRERGEIRERGVKFGSDVG